MKVTELSKHSVDRESFTAEYERWEQESYEHYIRQLVLVASDGDDRARRLFVRDNARIIGGYAGYLLNLFEETLEEAFSDSLTALRGFLPHTLMGFRLAFPVSSRNDRENMWFLWGKVAANRPGPPAADRTCEPPGRVRLTEVLTFPGCRWPTLGNV